MKNLLKLFGLCFISEKESVETELVNREEEWKNKLKNKENEIFDFTYFIPAVSSQEYYAGRHSAKKFEEWWSKYNENPLCAYNIRLLSKKPDLLCTFLNVFCKVEWNKIRDYMQKHNWGWGDCEKVPSIEQMQKAVISLTSWKSEAGFFIGGKFESGGFCVELDEKTNFCEIKFDNQFIYNNK